ncbi:MULTISPECIES: stage II sporulation protein M [Niastella]|uniref:Stage II sporulation protein M n=1 Tax=Niastella soli TaxID=2821487 RepID=A0ABS3YVA4_9BACT|nr:stage II sporulation protein M [Niastella soli]MBO9201832.1 stage II sporulation protein M [Niastella soli]
MREGLFIKKNIDKWRKYQYEETTDPDEMAQQFTELVNDLGYSKTFYPHSKVTQYLNDLASRIYLSIYRNKREETSRIGRFFKTELPLTVRKHHREILYAFLIFVGFAVMAAFSAAHDESFVRGVLGDSYVEMTEDNISKGDPFGVYRHTNALNMFAYIALNNIYISFQVFVWGLFLGLGSVYELFTNGVMVGSFQYYFFAKHLGWSSVLVIWIHGTLEISAIILSGAAGLIVGNSILFPGSHKRIHSLMQGVKDGLKLMIALVPILLVAAFLEGFVTRWSYYSMPRWVSILILAASFIFIMWYFVWYPIQVQRKTKAEKAVE